MKLRSAPKGVPIYVKHLGKSIRGEDRDGYPTVLYGGKYITITNIDVEVIKNQ